MEQLTAKQEKWAKEMKLKALDMAFGTGSLGAHIGGGFSAMEIYSVLYSGILKVKIFPDLPNVEWARFVDANRHASETGFTHSYDIVVGPVADDGVAFQLERFHEQMIDDETLARELTYKELNRQYYFGTEKAIAKLKKI